MKRRKYRKAIFILIYTVVKNKPQYLLLKRKLHWIGWEFPKGGIELQKTKFFGELPKRGRFKGGKNFFETDLMTLKRELKEETGLQIIKIKKKFKINEDYDYDKKYIDRKGFLGQKYKTLFAVEVEKKKPKLDKLEHSDFKWVNFKTATKMLTWENQKKMLRMVDKEITF